MNLKALEYLACRDRRDLPLEQCGLSFTTRAAGDDSPVEFQGYASVWGRVDSYGDTVLKGAFMDALKSRRPMMLYGHNPSRVPGKFVDVVEDDKGLKVVGQLTPGHSEAKDIAASLRFGSLNGLSIGGYTTDWEDQKSGGRIIKAFDLYEISVVSMPAEQEARIDSASVKTMIETASKLSDFEDLLREAAGFSKKAATAVVSRFARIVRGDPEGEASSKAASEFARLIQSTKIPESLTG